MYAIMRDCKGVLARFTDVVIALVSFLVLVYLLDDLIRVLPLSRGLGSIVVQLTFVGVPAALLLSLISWIVINSKRFKWYVAISVVEVLIMSGLSFIIMRSQI